MRGAQRLIGVPVSWDRIDGSRLIGLGIRIVRRPRMTPTPRQVRILAFLNRVYPHAGALFESALWIAADGRIPCRGRMIAHAYREICSVLMNEYSSNSRDVTRDKLNAFATEYRRLGFAIDAPVVSSPEPDSASTPVPQVFLRAAAEVVRAHSATDTARARARAVFEGLSNRPGSQPDIGPTSDRWFEMSRYFPKAAHDRTTPDAQLMGGQFQQEVEFFEETLSALFAESAVSNLDALDEVLEDANS
jgi:hypothetical protein